MNEDTVANFVPWLQGRFEPRECIVRSFLSLAQLRVKTGQTVISKGGVRVEGIPVGLENDERAWDNPPLRGKATLVVSIAGVIAAVDAFNVRVRNHFVRKAHRALVRSSVETINRWAVGFHAAGYDGRLPAASFFPGSNSFMSRGLRVLSRAHAWTIGLGRYG